MTATITVIGNTTADPELRFTQNGLAVVNFTVASTEKVFDKTTNQFKDGKTLFMRCSAWRDMAEHIAGSITKGTRVIVVGKIATREYETAQGEKRSSVELEIDSIGPDLRFATAQVTRAQSGGAGRGPAAVQDEPWAASAPSAGPSVPGSFPSAHAGAGGFDAPLGGYGDDTPF